MLTWLSAFPGARTQDTKQWDGANAKKDPAQKAESLFIDKSTKFGNSSQVKFRPGNQLLVPALMSARSIKIQC